MPHRIIKTQIGNSQSSNLTFGELAAAYLERHAHHFKSKIHLEQKIRNHLGHWMPLPVEEITRQKVGELHHAIGRKTPVQANRILAILHSMFALGEEWGLIEEGTKNPAARIKRFREKKRSRYLNAEELKRFFAAVNDQPPQYRAFFSLLIMTGARRGEMLRMKWSQISFENRTWEIPDTKSGNPHMVPLSEGAISILRSLKKRGFYVFPGKRASRPMTSYLQPWNAIRAAARIGDVTIHDLRRTLASWMACNGESLLVIAQVLNHRSLEATKIYARLNMAPVRQAMEKTNVAMRKVSGEPRKIPVQIPQRRKNSR